MTPIGDDLWEFTGMYPEILENIKVLKKKFGGLVVLPSDLCTFEKRLPNSSSQKQTEQ